VQVPAATRLAVVPETVQTLVVVEAKLTANPEVAVAFSPSVVPRLWVPIAPKLIVWDFRATGVTVIVKVSVLFTPWGLV
jgi:hypothetical protein